MKKILITPDEVVQLAFDSPQYMPAQSVSEAVILSAQHKFIRPVLGTLYSSLLDERYPELAELVKAPLALYVKWLLMPSLAVQSGPLGVVQHRGTNFSPAGSAGLSAARRRVKADARALMQAVREYVSQAGIADQLGSETLPGGIVL